MALLIVATGCADDDPEAIVAALTADPGAVRFQSVREQGEHVCGEVNARERQGGYTGYRRFVYTQQTKTAVIDPAAPQVEAATPPPGAACAKPFAYQTVEERLSCAYAPATTAALDRHRDFETLWAATCAPQDTIR
jgi:hypothetical protein